MPDGSDLTRDASAPVVVELRGLADRFPVPHPSWHAQVPEMRAVLHDLRAAIAVLDSHDAARAELVRLIGEEAQPAAAGEGRPALTAARRRLRELAVPAGEHPFLDEIVVTIEAAEAALAALSASADGDRAFADALDEDSPW